MYCYSNAENVKVTGVTDNTVNQTELLFCYYHYYSYGWLDGLVVITLDMRLVVVVSIVGHDTVW